jgi:hypothetical protein
VASHNRLALIPMKSMRQMPESDLDLFSDAALLHPYPLYGEARAAGAAVWIRRLKAFAVPTQQRGRTA